MSLSKKFPTLCANNNLTLTDMHNILMSIDLICNVLLVMLYINSYEMFVDEQYLSNLTSKHNQRNLLENLRNFIAHLSPALQINVKYKK